MLAAACRGVHFGGEGGDHAALAGVPPPSAISVSTAPLPPLAGRGQLGVALPGQPGGLIGEAAIDQRLDAVGLRQSEPDGGAEIGDGARAGSPILR